MITLVKDCSKHTRAQSIDPYQGEEAHDGYYVAYKLITLLCISFMLIEMKYIHCHSCVMFEMKSMTIYNN